MTRHQCITVILAILSSAHIICDAMMKPVSRRSYTLEHVSPIHIYTDGNESICKNTKKAQSDMCLYNSCKLMIESTNSKYTRDALFKLGCMSRSCLSCVPMSQRGNQAACTYFQKAANLGHRKALEELARSSIVMNDEKAALAYWHQADFLNCADGLEISPQDANNDLLIDMIVHASKQWPYLTDNVLQTCQFVQAYNKILGTTQNLASKGVARAAFLLARLYAQMRPCGPKERTLIVDTLRKILSATSHEQAMQFIDSTNSLNALILAADNDDEQFCLLLGKKLYSQGLYAQAWHYLDQAAQKEDVEAQCYCAVMQITGKGVTSNIANSHMLIETVLKTDKKKENLKLFANLCDVLEEKTLKKLAPSDKQASYLLGLILFEKKQDTEQAFRYLKKSAEPENLFATYCCVCMSIHGHAKEWTVERALKSIIDVLLNNNCDSSLRALCLDELHNLSASQKAPAIAKYCIARINDTTFDQECTAIWRNMLKLPPEDQKIYVKSMNDHKKILSDQEKNYNPRACFMNGILHELRGMLEPENSNKIQELKIALTTFKKIKSKKFHVLQDKIRIINILANIFLAIGNMEEAIKYFEQDIALGNTDSKRYLACAIIQNSNATQQQINRALKLVEDCAEQGDTEMQCLVSRIYLKDSRVAGSNALIKANIAKACHFAQKASAHDSYCEGHYVMARLLFEFGGFQHIKQDDTRAYELMSRATTNNGTLEPIDFYYMGRYCFERNDYQKAQEWFEKAPDFPGCLCYKGLIEFEQYKNFTKGLEDIERALALIQYHVWPYAKNNYDRFLHPRLLSSLQQLSKEGNIHARIILARLVARFAPELIGTSLQEARTYVLEGAAQKLMNAHVYLGSMYAHGIMEQTNYDKAVESFKLVIEADNVPVYLQEEVAAELFRIGNENNTKLAVLACYYAIPILISRNTDSTIKQAIYMLNRAESTLGIHLWTDPELVKECNKIGAWQALSTFAATNADAAANLGLAGLVRFLKGLADYQTFKTEYLPLMETALSLHAKLFDANYLSSRLVLVAKHCSGIKACSYEEIRRLLERALVLNPDNLDAKQQLSNIYIQCLCNDISVTENIRRGQKILDELIELDYVPALLEAGILLIPKLGQKDFDVKSRDKGIAYLKRAAAKGSPEASVVLACQQEGITKKARLALQKNLQKKSGLQDNNLKASSTFAHGAQALAQQDFGTAFECFSKFEQEVESAKSRAEAAIILFEMKHEYSQAMNELANAIDLVAKEKISLSGSHIERIIKTILQKLDSNEEHDQHFAQYAKKVRGKLEQYGFSI